MAIERLPAPCVELLKLLAQSPEPLAIENIPQRLRETALPVVVGRGLVELVDLLDPAVNPLVADAERRAREWKENATYPAFRTTEIPGNFTCARLTKEGKGFLVELQLPSNDPLLIDLPDREREVYELIRDHGPLIGKHICGRIDGLHPKSLPRIIKELKSRELIGNRRGVGYYVLPESQRR